MTQKNIENAVKAVVASIMENTSKFDLQLGEWRFVMYPQLKVYFARDKISPIFIIYNFEDISVSHEILSRALNQLKVDEVNIDYGENHQPLQGQYLICYYPLQIKLLP